MHRTKRQNWKNNKNKANILERLKIQIPVYKIGKMGNSYRQ